MHSSTRKRRRRNVSMQRHSWCEPGDWASLGYQCCPVVQRLCLFPHQFLLSFPCSHRTYLPVNDPLPSPLPLAEKARCPMSGAMVQRRPQQSVGRGGAGATAPTPKPDLFGGTLTNEAVANVCRYGIPVMVATVGLWVAGVKLSDVTETPSKAVSVMATWAWK